MPQVYRAIQPMFKTNRWRICRDDVVCILSGPDKGKTGKVLEVLKDRRVPQVIVEGRNMRKKKVRTGSDPDDYFVVTMEAPLHYSRVQLADPETGKPVRVVFMYTPDGQKVRARKVANPTVNDILPTPPEEAPNPRAGLVGKKDTPQALASKATYAPAAGFPFRVHKLEGAWAGSVGAAAAAAAKDAGVDLGAEDAEVSSGSGSGSGRSAAAQLAAALAAARAAGGAGGALAAARGLCTAAAAAASCSGSGSSADGGGAVAGAQAAGGPDEAHLVAALPRPALPAATFALLGLRPGLLGLGAGGSGWRGPWRV